MSLKGSIRIGAFTAFLMLSAVIARAQYQAIPNFVGTGAGQEFRDAVNERLGGSVSISPLLTPYSFAALPAEQDGQVLWCRDCSKSEVCAGGGAGAYAFGQGGQWTCAASALPMNSLPSATGPVPFNGERATGLGANTNTGDALSQGQSNLNALTPPTANFNMGSFTLTNTGTANGPGEPIVYNQQNAQLTGPALPTQISQSSLGFVFSPSSATISAPVGITGSNQVAFAVLSYQSSGTASFTMPSGWANIASATSCNGGSCQRVDYKMMTTSEPSGYTWASISNVSGLSGAIVLFGNINTATPYDKASTWNSGSTLGITALPPTSGNPPELAFISASGNSPVSITSALPSGLRSAFTVTTINWMGAGWTLPVTPSGIGGPNGGGAALSLANNDPFGGSTVASELLLEGVSTGADVVGPVNSDIGPRMMLGLNDDGSNRIANYSENDVLNIKAYGAVGDSATCDDPIWQSVINIACGDGPNFSRSVFAPATPHSSYAFCKPVAVPCGNLNLFGAGEYATSVTNKYSGQSFITGSVPTATNGQGSELQYVNSLITSGGGNAFKLNNCSGNNCGYLMLSDYLGGGRLSGLSAFSLEFTINVQSTINATYNLLRSYNEDPTFTGASGNDGMFRAQYVYNSGTSGQMLFLISTTGGQTFISAPANSLPAGTNESFDLDYDGSHIRICQNGTLEQTGSASGSTVQGNFEVSALPDLFLMYPDVVAASSGIPPVTIDNIRFSNVSRYAANGNACPSTPTSKFSADGNTILSLPFLSCSDGSQYCINGAPGAFAQYAQAANGRNIWLGIRNNGSGSNVSNLSMHDMSFQEILANWNTGSLFERLASSPSDDAPVFNFDNNDWYSRFENLSASGNTTDIGFKFGGATNHPIDTNLSSNNTMVCFDYASTFTGIVSHGAKCNPFGISKVGWMMREAGGTWDDIVMDSEGADSFLSQIYAYDNIEPIIFTGGEVDTYNASPFVIQGGNGQPIIFNGFTFNGFASNTNAAELIDFLSGGDPVAPDLLINSYNVQGVALSNESGNPHVEVAGGAATTLQSLNVAYLNTSSPPTLSAGVNHLLVNYLTTPSAPSISVGGSTGSTTYGPYYVVCHDDNGGETMPSGSSNTVTNGPSSLSSGNYINVNWTAETGCASWDLLKGNTTTALATELPGGTTTYHDIGGSTSSYTQPVRNTTGDVQGGVLYSSGVTFANLPVTPVNGARIYCSNCDPPASPPTACTSTAAKTGAFAEGVNGTWYCAY